MIKIILISVAIILILLVVGFVFVLWMMGSGLNNKYGPEFIPRHLGIEFNHFKYVLEDSEKFLYMLQGNELSEVTSQIENLIREQKPSNLKHGFIWKVNSDNEFELFNSETNQVLATFNEGNGRLIYNRIGLRN